MGDRLMVNLLHDARWAESAITESGGVVVWAMVPEVAGALADALEEAFPHDRGWMPDVLELRDMVERIEVFRALLKPPEPMTPRSRSRT